MTKAQKAWATVAEGFERGVYEGGYGLCYAFSYATKGQIDREVYVAVGRLCDAVGAKRNAVAFIIFEPDEDRDAIRATLAALFAAMSDGERAEITSRDDGE